MKKTKEVKGKALKNAYDITLAKPHKKGAVVEVVQTAKDNKWGRYYLTKRFRYPNILNRSDDYLCETLSLLGKCRQLEVGKDNARFVPENIKIDLELVSMNFLLFFKLGFEYLTLELLDSINTIKQNTKGSPRIDWQNIDLLERIEILKRNLNYSAKTPKSLALLFERRNIVEHPSSERIYNNGEHTWKSVHIAWVLSGEIENLCDDVGTFVNDLTTSYNKFVEANKMAGTLLNVKRGLKSDDPYKKYKK